MTVVVPHLQQRCDVQLQMMAFVPHLQQRCDVQLQMMAFYLLRCRLVHRPEVVLVSVKKPLFHLTAEAGKHLAREALLKLDETLRQE
jgi:hypothetical protein